MSAEPHPLTAPDCSGMTVDACIAAFAAAGFTATPRIIWEDGAQTGTAVGEVTATTPAAGRLIARSNSDHPIGIAGAGIVVPDPADLEDPSLAAYEAVLTDAGFTSIIVELHDRDWRNRGNNAVSMTDHPKPGTAVDPRHVDSTWVRFQAGPFTAPEPRH